jgi:iron complex transport system ATP-binding protein
MVISNLTAQAPGGKLTSLLGRNGSGKTTVLRAMVKHILPISGAICIGGRDLGALDVSDLPRYLSYTPSEAGNVGLKCIDVVSSGKRHGSWINPKQALGALKELAIPGLSNKQFDEISTGQKRLVLIARAMAIGAPVALFDEPTLGLDPSNRSSVVRAIKDMSARHGTTAIVATQDTGLAAMSDWLIAIKDGEAMASGPARILTRKMLSMLYAVSEGGKSR